MLAEIGRLGLSNVIATPGFVEPDVIDEAIGSAACLLQPSTREGYGLVVVEASAKGTPSVVVAAPDNAAVELIDAGMNGFIAPTSKSTDLAAAIVRCVEGGDAMRDRASAWANARGEGLTVRGSMRQVLELYDRATTMVTS